MTHLKNPVRRGAMQFRTLAGSAALACVCAAAHAAPQPSLALRITEPAAGYFGYAVVALTSTNSAAETREIAIANPVFATDAGARGRVTIHRFNGAAMVVTDTIAPPPEDASSQFGSALAVGDFDENGRDDLLIGAPFLDGGAGGVYWWRRTGTNTTSLELVYAPALLQSGICGASLAVGDFDGDGHADFATGCPYHSVGDAEEAGTVVVGYGDGDGGFAFISLSQDTAGVGGTAESGDHFGHAIAAGLFNADQIDDLAVGVPDETVEGIVRAGALNVLFAVGGTGLTGAGSQLLHQGVAGVPGDAEADDRFARTLATGRRNMGTEHEYLAVGVQDDDGSAGGAVLVFEDGTSGLETGNVQRLTPSDFPPDPLGLSPGPAADARSRFGFSLATGLLDADQWPDLLIGVGGYTVSFPVPFTVPGMVCVAYGRGPDTGNAVLDGRRRCYGGAQFGAPTASDGSFGIAAAAARLDGQREAELVIGAPASNLALVLKNRLFADAFESAP